MPRILELSAEVLIELFSQLFFTDLFSCKQTCRMFCEVISNSTRLNYQIELNKAGMLDNPACPLSLTTRLEMLRNRELAWASFDFKFITQVLVPSHSAGIYDVTAGVLLLGKENPDMEFVANGVQSVRLPSTDGEDVSTEWKNLDLGITILDIRPAIEEADLLAFVVFVPENDNPQIWNINILLRQYSDTNKTHGAASKPTIFVDRVLPHQGIPEVSIDISGENLAMVVMFPDDLHGSREANNLFVFNWKSGDSKTRLPTQVYNSVVVFLREDILLRPNTATGSLDIYHISQASANSKPDRVFMLLSLGLPPLNPDYGISFVAFRGEPGSNRNNDFPKYTPTTAPYVSDPKNAIMRLSLQIDSIENEDDENYFVMIVHRQALLDLVDLDRVGQPADLPNAWKYFPWDAWGPPVTQWFEGDIFLSEFMMDTFGQRYIQLTNPRNEINENSEGPHNSIHIFDFNPFHVKFMAKYGTNVVAKRNLELCIVRENLRFYFGPGSPMNKYPGSAKGIFTQTLIGKLPYVEIISNGWPEGEYDGIFIDQERLMAIGTDHETDTYRITSMDVIYFG